MKCKIHWKNILIKSFVFVFIDSVFIDVTVERKCFQIYMSNLGITDGLFVTLTNLYLPITRSLYIVISWNHHYLVAKHVFLPILSVGLGFSDTKTHLQIKGSNENLWTLLSHGSQFWPPETRAPVHNQRVKTSVQLGLKNW